MCHGISCVCEFTIRDVQYGLPNNLFVHDVCCQVFRIQNSCSTQASLQTLLSKIAFHIGIGSLLVCVKLKHAKTVFFVQLNHSGLHALYGDIKNCFSKYMPTLV